jgi:hypothetical protein
MKTTSSPDKPARVEIDNHIMKLAVGIMAISLPFVTNWLAPKPDLLSISESYWRGGWAESIFVGVLFAIAAFLFAYNGESTLQMIASKLASFAAVCVALFPCDCDCKLTAKVGATTIPCTDAFVPIPYVHFIAAGVMFVVLAYFCYAFRSRALKPKDGFDIVFGEAKLRAAIYMACGIAIVTVIVAVSADGLLTAKDAIRGPIATSWNEFVFWAEATGLVAFGIAWLVASRTIPLITNEAERYSLSPYTKQVEN